MTGYNFTPIMSILIAIIPIMLVIYVLKYFKKILGKLETTKPYNKAENTINHIHTKIAISAVLLAFLVVGFCSTNVSAGAGTTYGKADPTTGTALLNFPFPIQYSALNASETYVVYDNGVANGVTFDSASDGTAIYNYVGSVSGTHTVALKMSGDGTYSVSSVVLITDVIADYFIPIMMIAIVLSVLGSVIYMIDKELKS